MRIDTLSSNRCAHGSDGLFMSEAIGVRKCRFGNIWLNGSRDVRAPDRVRDASGDSDRNIGLHCAGE